ncbi:MAG TPA: cytochrome P450 [Acidimicrobiales bacterium]|nr:cytochrome P450 [Acidimicrobiales bacterium]
MTQATELTSPLVTDGFFAGDPWPLLARLRHDAPLAYNDEIGAWFASTHADVHAASVDNATFCSGKGILTFEIGVEYPTPPTMMHTDPPEHTRYRKLVQPAFGPRQMRALEPVIRARTRRLLDALPSDEPVDIVPGLAEPLPLQVIGLILGVDEADHDRFLEWSEAAIPGAAPLEPTEQQRRMAAMHDYLLEVARDRRANPRDDVITALATAEIDADRLSDAELEMFLVQLLVAGNETTRHAISGGLRALAERPDQWAALREDPSRIPTAFEEVLRWTTPVIYFMRTATRHTELSGTPIRAGDPVVLLYASANRDETVFGADAGEFRSDRTPNPHLAFGFGAHFCLGAALARLEGRVLLEEMVDRYATLEPVGDVARTQSLVIAGISAATVTLRPA